jgi:diacylglycerol kinase family enzyme
MSSGSRLKKMSRRRRSWRTLKVRSSSTSGWTSSSCSARDLGLDRNDPIGALDSFVNGEEHTIDIGRAGGQPFLNNASLGVYALLVHSRERHRRRRDAFARLRALAIVATLKGSKIPIRYGRMS